MALDDFTFLWKFLLQFWPIQNFTLNRNKKWGLSRAQRVEKGVIGQVWLGYRGTNLIQIFYVPKRVHLIIYIYQYTFTCVKCIIIIINDV